MGISKGDIGVNFSYVFCLKNLNLDGVVGYSIKLF